VRIESIDGNGHGNEGGVENRIVEGKGREGRREEGLRAKKKQTYR
jgi:hypothetical protein